ncbi:MAG TPA: formylmethanofuran dehydrogenase [Syntrophothermus lipocalidus]|uniref:Formylmethanofuran dehydrogenase subunit E region n=1 Tax=Syntrophothermus lipocalidus (strain DSM 12680 / TGB-C1) TaxID=643648 RepID=D7CK49_SYNLT|nr:FmdE family protein [Syntrophothermus lipocalidus]ADI01163.1 formylmethanofuran dehydrogenase subunit E region [Syntrophothermus lipocalidus DSM 12680]HHV77911.1 formylmethanofuran dehydrogenase [Syntrophothermus lipocalidus]
MCQDMSPLEKAVQFHGHICPGLLRGVRVAEFAQHYLGINRDEDEEVVAVVENDACGVDAIQAILGCTFGKGNLLFRDYGKQVYTIISRNQNRAVRIAEKFGALVGPEFTRYRELANKSGLSREEQSEKEQLQAVMFEAIMTRPFEDMFDYREVSPAVPPRAVIRKSVRCDGCGEAVMETRATLTSKGWLCRECLEERAS